MRRILMVCALIGAVFGFVYKAWAFCGFYVARAEIAKKMKVEGELGSRKGGEEWWKKIW